MTDELGALIRELRSRQARLGTSAEQYEDFEPVLCLAHNIKNQLTAFFIQESMKPGSDDATVRRTVRAAISR